MKHRKPLDFGGSLLVIPYIFPYKLYRINLTY